MTTIIEDHPIRTKRFRKFPKVDRDAPVSGGIADPGPGPHEVTVIPLDANGVASEEQVVAPDDAPAEPGSPEGEVLAPTPAPNPQPEVEVEASVDTDLSGMSMPEVLLWAGDDPDRRAYALAAEQAREKPRKGVLSALGK